MDQHSEIPARDDRVDAAIAVYLDAVDNGQAPDLARFIEQHSEIADELNSFLADESQFAQVVNELNPASTSQGASAGGSAKKSASDADEPTQAFHEQGDSAAAEVLCRFRDYELLAEIARGGMGVVFKARQVKLNRIVAVKMILAGSFAGPADIERFHTEAEAVAKLDHPGIVPIYEVGEHAGQHFFSMAYVEGESLSKKLTHGPLPVREAVEVVRVVSAAVQYAHDKGVIHRDLKPGNILLDKFGKPRVTDFGLAKLTDSGSDLTGTKEILGTPGYMPPEQASGKGPSVGRSSDVYSLGAILYCLLTGRPPFQAASALETLMQVRNQEPVSPRQLNLGLPLDLETIVLKCLDKTPLRRYGSAQDLADELQRYLDGRPILARPVSRLERARRWCRRNPQVAALTAAVIASLLMGTGVSIVLAVKARQRESDATASAVAAEAARIRANESLQEANAARTFASSEASKALALADKNEKLARDNAAALYRLSVDHGMKMSTHGDLYGALLWYAKSIRESDNIACRTAARMRIGNYLRYTPRFRNVQLLHHDGEVNHFDIDPKGRRIVTACNDFTARIWDVESGLPVGKPLTHLGKVVSAQFSRDGLRVVTASEDGTARIWDATSGQALGAPLRHEAANPHLAVNDNGKTVKVRSAEFNADGTCLLTVDSEGAAQRWDAATGVRIGPPLAHKSVNSAVFDPPGRRIITAGGDGTARGWAVLDGEPAGPRFGTEGNVVSLNAAIRDPVFSLDGRWIATINFGNSVHIWEAATGRRMSRLLVRRNIVNQATFSPDGKLVVTALADGTARIWDRATGQSAGPPLVHDHEVELAVFSPDGRSIATASGAKVYVWEAASGRDLAPPLLHHADVTCVRFSPDGFRIITSSEDRTARIWELSEGQPDGPLPAADSVEFPSFYDFKHSHGSRTLQINAQRSSVAVVNNSSRSVVEGPVHESKVTSATFSPDGLWVATTSNDGTSWIWGSDAGRASFPAIQDVSTIAFSPDGRYFVTTSFRNQAKVWEAATGQPVGAAMIHESPVNSALFSPDGLFIVTASADKTARLWESATGREVAPPLLHRTAVTYAGFERGGRSIVTYAGDERWRWDVAPDDHADDDVLAMMRLLSGRKLDEQDGIQAVSTESLDSLQDLLRRRCPEAFLAAAPEFVLNWRLRQIDDAESKNHWSAVAYHLDQLAASAPSVASLSIRRAVARLNAIPEPPTSANQLATILDFPGNLDELARTDPVWWCCDSRVITLVSEGKGENIAEFLSSVLQLGPDDLEWWTIPASVSLAAGNLERHQQICRQVLERFAEVADAPKAMSILAIILLDNEPDGASRAALSRLGGLVERDFIDESSIVGAVRFREQQYQAALEQIEISARDPESDAHGAWDQFFLAMIHHRLGQTDKAGDHFQRALEWIETNPDISWIRKAELSELRRQAALLMGIAAK